ncbi:hypothetical protein Scep_027497 [Stephania cephalantha]|uniref:Uncharacterized protein n=1 Tax=Stephania cephalantha TaxID=152367 RepID=A0AAP0EAF1_9MAGN
MAFVDVIKVLEVRRNENGDKWGLLESLKELRPRLPEKWRRSHLSYCRGRLDSRHIFIKKSS